MNSSWCFPIFISAHALTAMNMLLEAEDEVEEVVEFEGQAADVFLPRTRCPPLDCPPSYLALAAPHWPVLPRQPRRSPLADLSAKGCWSDRFVGPSKSVRETPNARIQA